MQISYTHTVDSTQDLAMAAARSGAEAGTVFLADVQLQGRGRRVDGQTRRWHAPAGSSLLMSVVLRPPLSAQQSSTLTLAAGVAAAEVLRDVCEVPVTLKWPNDLMVGPRKLGGILAEGLIEGSSLEAVIVGMGINVNLDTAALPEALQARATSLSGEAGRHHDRLSLLTRLAPALLEATSALADPDARADLLSRWEALSDMIGEPVEALIGGAMTPCRALGLAPDGALRVEDDAGATHLVRAGALRWPT